MSEVNVTEDNAPIAQTRYSIGKGAYKQSFFLSDSDVARWLIRNPGGYPDPIVKVSAELTPQEEAANAAQAGAAEAEGPKPLSRMNKAELEAYAAEHGISLTGAATNKAKLLAIETAEAADGMIPDFGAMNRAGLEAWATKNEVDIPDGADDDAVRELLVEAASE